MEFDVDVHSGFLPSSTPIARFEQAPWTVWEDALDSMKGFRVGTGESENAQISIWRSYIRQKMEVLDIEPLKNDIALLRRAHVVLAFLTHAYVHLENADEAAKDGFSVLVPRSISIPFCAVSEALDMPPVLTYADTVLYNWSLIDPSAGFEASNIHIPTTFTATDSEAHFFKTSVLVEALGPACLALMRSSLDEAFLGDALSIRRICRNLGQLSKMIDQITQVLQDVRTDCDPRTFYWEIRPWFNGGEWTMEGVPSKDNQKLDGSRSESGWRVCNLGGPSAGQSTLIHAIDIFLDVNHRPNEAEIKAGARKEDTFMSRMSAYMPHHHRLFLRHLSSYFTDGETNSIRSLVLASEEDSELRTSYNLTIKSMEKLRNAHSRIAILYIVSQSRVEPPEGSSFHLRWKVKMETEKVNRHLNSSVDGSTNEVHSGTGGTDLAKFLKRCRQRTIQNLV
ncbi:Indoleamine 2,3-dioxygenase [Phakopsora pachyrhizi]|uniref:Indoleamine 2,3-dioxygenase n=1 Tax=Phakopsora pachyrhizi TaxID=170000 RepID=A0AAV0B3M2_PHAPC|nr:Indoleamine 2,3-dioxygenase [Phakopsora pachyrhizi]